MIQSPLKSVGVFLHASSFELKKWRQVDQIKWNRNHCNTRPWCLLSPRCLEISVLVFAYGFCHGCKKGIKSLWQDYWIGIKSQIWGSSDFTQLHPWTHWYAKIFLGSSLFSSSHAFIYHIFLSKCASLKHLRNIYVWWEVEPLQIG